MLFQKSIYNLLFISLFLLFFSLNENISAQSKIPKKFCISPQEKLLFDQLNQLIKDYGKAKLELSASLSYVAKVHVSDLLNYHPDTSFCNMSSWSDKGDWTPCCHNPYIPQQDCMWDKPKELTQYPYRGYELVSYFEEEFNVDSVMNLWSSSKQVLDMVLMNGNFDKKRWVCMGVGMNENYVSVWFGQRGDNQKKPGVCDDSKIIIVEKSQVNIDERYYIIFGSYLNTRDAKEAVKRLSNNGFDDAGILTTNDKVRVYLNNFSNIKEAMFYKQQLPYSYHEAWIYKE